jgi:hypothetical protein
MENETRQIKGIIILIKIWKLNVDRDDNLIL